MSGSYSILLSAVIQISGCLIIFDFAGYFRKHHWKISTLSPRSFSLPLEELVRAALDIVRLWLFSGKISWLPHEELLECLFINQLEILLMKVDQAWASCPRSPALLQARAVTAQLCTSSCHWWFWPSYAQAKMGFFLCTVLMTATCKSNTEFCMSIYTQFTVELPGIARV